MIADPAVLARALKHRFSDAALLRQALTHCSAGSVNNERLEFLGDGALNFIIAAALFERFAQVPEGKLSRLRAKLVKRETLAEVARGLELGDYLRLGSGELKSGGFRRESILADAMEAVIGAVYRDAGFDACRELVLRLWTPFLERIDPERDLKDAKTRLQELLQGNKRELPEYQVLEVSGVEHEQQFRVSCTVEGEPPVIGDGNSRRRAEQNAARAMLERLENAS